MKYVAHIPKSIPPDLILVHNIVRPQPLGHNGFRAWLDAPEPRYVPCDCGWAPDIQTHYRVDRELAGTAA